MRLHRAKRDFATLDVKRTENVTDVVNVGDIIRVKVMEIDDKGRLNLSRRQVLIDVDGLTPENEPEDSKPARPCLFFRTRRSVQAPARSRRCT